MTQRRACTAALILLCLAPFAHAADLRLGIIGTDSSHAVEFTRILNDPTATDHVDGARIVAAYRGGSSTYPLSRDRIAGFTATLTTQWKLPFVARIQDLCPMVDGLLLLSVDPSTREREFREAAVCNKPVFIDKPLAPTLQTASSIARFASRHHVPWFTASALRFGAAQQLKTSDLRGADVWGPGALGDAPALDLSWYGIHSIEILYAVLGPGVQAVSRTHTPRSDVLTAVWSDGRIGTVHLTRPDMAFGLVAYQAGGRATVREDLPILYAPLLRQIVLFMQTGRSPVDPGEMLEVFAFMDAAQRSMERGGSPVHLTQPQAAVQAN